MKTITLIMLIIASCSVTATEVTLTKNGGVYQVPVRINDQITLNFVLDSGAGDVQMPEDVIRTLIRTGTISESDFLESKNYTQADGTTVTSNRILIKQLQVGDEILHNVTASISKNDGALLLGQSFLERFSGWSIDNSKQALVLGAQLDGQQVQQQATYAAASTAEQPMVTWYKDNEYGMRIFATDKLCDSKSLVEQGYQFNIASSIPVDRLKNQNDAYYVNDTYAITVKGCWSPVMHKAYWHRKHDGNEWSADFRVDDTWIKVDGNDTKETSAKVDNNEIVEGFTTINVDNDTLTLQANDVTYLKGGFLLQYIDAYKKPILVDGVDYKYHKTSFIIDCNKETASVFKDNYGNVKGNATTETISPYNPVQFTKDSNFGLAAKKFCK